jgi:murein DD-endopeptidase MepM/ murein hydrolase activator NlpD
MRWKKLIPPLLLILAVAAGIWFVVVRMEREAPSLSFEGELRYIGRETEWSFVAEDQKSGLRQVRVWVRQGSKVQEAFAEDFPSAGWRAKDGVKRREVSLSLSSETLGLSNGAATVIVAAQDNSLWSFKGNSTFRELPILVDTTPPRIDVLSTVHNVRKGGTGLVAFRLNEEVETVGVEVGGRFFPAYPAATAGEGSHLAYFAVAPDSGDEVSPALMAVDMAGNEARRTFPVRILDKKFPRDTIGISDGFLRRKVPEFQSADPSLDSDLLQAYITVNRDWRSRDHDRLRALCAESRPERLWKGAFMQMENSKNMAPYAVRRTYVYKGKVIDRQVHLGLDLASTARAPVPAANAGVVKFADDLGIYGRTVLVDHGQGLFSLYSHLSGFSVAAGDAVGRGQVLAASGQTGMAGGDHLHFSILVSGEFVNPVEWLDGHWIADNIENKLERLYAVPGR